MAALSVAITVLIALTWRWFFPALAEVDRLEHISPPESAVAEVRV